MKIIERISGELKNIVEDKSILEIACGDSEFSLEISKYASSVLATDISLKRFLKRGLKDIPSNLTFEEMNAADLNLPDDRFDIVACYNALAHLEEDLDDVLQEMVRVVRKGGYILFVVTWKMEKRLIQRVAESLTAKGEEEYLKIVKKDYAIHIFHQVR